MHAKSVLKMQRQNHAGNSANAARPPLVNKFIRYVFVHTALAGLHPYRQMCSIIKEAPNASAHAIHMPHPHRMRQNICAIGVFSCSLYAVDRNISIPLPLPDADKILNFLAIVL